MWLRQQTKQLTKHTTTTSHLRLCRVRTTTASAHPSPNTRQIRLMERTLSPSHTDEATIATAAIAK
jgi:hypothetical protein